LSEDDRNILVLYYLFHDIGHIPNSHVSEPLLRLLPSKDKIKFHASLSSHLFESDKETKKWILSNTPNGLIIWESINKIFNKNFSGISYIICQIIKSPINPDTLEGIYRTACILYIERVLPEYIVAGIYLDKEVILYSNNNINVLYEFIELEKTIYDKYVYGLPNQSAEAMWKKALLIVMLDDKITEERIFRMTEEELIGIMMDNPFSKKIIDNLRKGKCLTPYWVNSYSNKMSNEYANISNNVYSNFFSLSCIEKNISDAVSDLKSDNPLALHFSRLREFALSKQNTLWDNTIAFKSIISIKKSQGIVPLSVFGSPYISIDELERTNFKSSQQTINNIIRNYFTIKPIIITTPFSPNDTNPPAGPIVLKSYAKYHGVDIETIDLNIKYINLFNGEDYKFTFGDHSKSNKIDKAYSFFKESIEYPTISDNSIPDCIDIARSFPFSFDQIAYIVDKIVDEKGFWIDFLDKQFFDKYKEEPPLIGFSIMGTTQLIVSMILSKLIKIKWRHTFIVAGGTHVTLKREQLKNDKRYFDYFDYFLPFHSEHIFLKCLYNLNHIPEVKGIISWEFAYT
jgi:HD superfamily phosphohydrolase